jgi:hypothetical protein
VSILTEDGVRTVDAAREGVLRELRAVESTPASAPDLEDLRRRMPQANGDQDAW